jgi:hypothetical protein
MVKRQLQFAILNGWWKADELDNEIQWIVSSELGEKEYIFL